MAASLWLLSGTYLYLSPNLPDVEKLRDVKLQTPMEILTQDGELIHYTRTGGKSPKSVSMSARQIILGKLERT